MRNSLPSPPLLLPDRGCFPPLSLPSSSRSIHCWLRLRTRAFHVYQRNYYALLRSPFAAAAASSAINAQLKLLRQPLAGEAPARAASARGAALPFAARALAAGGREEALMDQLSMLGHGARVRAAVEAVAARGEGGGGGGGGGALAAS